MPRARTRWKLFMLAASYFFYGYWNWRFCFLLAASTIVQPAASRRSIHRNRRRDATAPLAAGAVVVNLGVLGYFKYYDFFVSSCAATCSTASGSTIVARDRRRSRCRSGISFFTFQALSYVIDIYRRTFEPAALHRLRGLPLVLPARRRRADRARRRVPAAAQGAPRPAPHRREPRVLPHLHRPVQEGRDRQLPRDRDRRPRVRVARAATRRSSCWSASTRTRCRSTPTSAATPTWRSGSRCCSASGSRRTSTRPYTAASLQDFWRRWHMTLSRWLRDYLYIPLGGNRGAQLPHVPQPHAHDGARRAVARRGVDVRRLGRASTAVVPVRRALAARVAAARRAPRTARHRRAPGRAPLRHVQRRVPARGCSSGPSRFDKAFELLGRLIDPRTGSTRRRWSRCRRASSRSPSASARSSSRRTSMGRAMAAFSRLVARGAGCGARFRPARHQHAGPARRRPLHLLPVLRHAGPHVDAHHRAPVRQRAADPRPAAALAAAVRRRRRGPAQADGCRPRAADRAHPPDGRLAAERAGHPEDGAGPVARLAARRGGVLRRPARTISHFLHIDRPREWLQDALGRGRATTTSTSRSRARRRSSTVPGGETTTTTQPPQEDAFSPEQAAAHLGRRRLARDHARRVADQPHRRHRGRRQSGARRSTAHVATGSPAPRSFNWPAYLRRIDRGQHDPNVVVFTVGSNDDQSRSPAAASIGDLGNPEWDDEYRRRVGGLMDQVAGRGAHAGLGRDPARSATRSASEGGTGSSTTSSSSEAEKRPGQGRLRRHLLAVPRRADGGYADYLANGAGGSCRCGPTTASTSRRAAATGRGRGFGAREELRPHSWRSAVPRPRPPGARERRREVRHDDPHHAAAAAPPWARAARRYREPVDLTPLIQPADTKILLVVMDGLGGYADAEHGTELEEADTPNLDGLAADGVTGLVEPVGPGITPGSGPGHLGLFGYDPEQFELGRGALSRGRPRLRAPTGRRRRPRQPRARSTPTARSPTGAPGASPTPRRRRSSTGCSDGVRLDGVEVFFRHEREHRVLVVLRGDGLDARPHRHRPAAHGCAAARAGAAGARGQAHRRAPRRARRRRCARSLADEPEGERHPAPRLRHAP